MPQPSAEKNPVPVSPTLQRRLTRNKFRLAAILLVFAGTLLGAAAWWLLNPAPLVLRVAAGEEGSATHALLREVASIAAQSSDGVRLEVLVTGERDGEGNRFETGATDLAAVRSDTELGADVRMVAGLYSNYFHLIVDDLIPAFRVDDLRRLKVVIPPFGTNGFRAFWLVTDPDGLSMNSLDWSATDFEAAGEGLLSGRYDALFTVRPMRDPALLELFEEARQRSRRLRYLPIHRADVIAAKWQHLDASAIAPGAISERIPRHRTATNRIEHYLVAGESAPPEAIRRLTGVMFQHRDELDKRTGLGPVIEEAKGTGGPGVHPGAALFYAGTEPEFWRENIAAIVMIVLAGVMPVLAVLSFWAGQRAARPRSADKYNDQLFDVEKRASESTSPTDLIELRVELDRILETALMAHEAGEVADVDYQQFKTFQESVRESIRAKQANLVGAD